MDIGYFGENRGLLKDDIPSSNKLVWGATVPVNDTIDRLLKKGAHIPNPESVEIGDDISVDRIAGQGVTLYSGSKLFGSETLICEGAQIGYEGPVTVIDCYIGPQVALKGGFFQESTFLKGSSCGLGAHVRGGTILEERANIAHTVGLKQTILFPFVTLGSLINFCDCLMAGGTSRKNHSEVGSSYIHFNFTPNQDKATPSLIGDVPRGVMLNQSPIFLGGQGGLVGPCRLTYGTVVAAGTICRKDQLKENYLVMEGGPRSARMPFKPGGYRNLKRILAHNFNFIANLMALSQWYRYIRDLFIGPDFPKPLADGLAATLNKGVSERITQLGKLRDQLTDDCSQGSGVEPAFCIGWSKTRESLMDLKFYDGSQKLRDQFLPFIEQGIHRHGKDYLRVIKDLGDKQTALGSQWLQSIVDHVTESVI
jgi:bifunctional UDP-N-acetylglucosamine pyrophosphorylase / glucosamine-1-phosphate N-acetyltransferase